MTPEGLMQEDLLLRSILQSWHMDHGTNIVPYQGYHPLLGTFNPFQGSQPNDKDSVDRLSTQEHTVVLELTPEN